MTDYSDAIAEARQLLRRRERVTLGNRRNGKGTAENAPSLPPSPPAVVVQPVYRIFSTIAPERVSWLSPGRIPLGKLTILEGDPGLGKSTLLAELTARVTRGDGFPGDPPFPPAWVVWLSGEDGAADTLAGRFDAAGADVSRVAILDGVRVGEEPEGEIDVVLPAPETLRALEVLLVLHPVKLVVVDVLSAFLSSGVDTYKDHDIRRALRPLKELAERTGVAIVVVRHITKGSAGGKAINAGGGSAGMGGAARSVLLVDRDPHDPALCVLAAVKTNCAAKPPSLSFAIVKKETKAYDVSMVEWHGESAETADSLTAARGGEATAREVDDFLRDVLTGDGLDRKTVMARAKDSGYSDRSVDRAAARLGVLKGRSGFGSGLHAVWRLPPIPATETPLAPFPPASEAGAIGAIGGNARAASPPEDAGDAWERSS